MQNRPSLIIVAVMALMALTAAVGLGYWQSHAAPPPTQQASTADTMRDRQQLERRRGRVAVVPIAGTTAR